MSYAVTIRMQLGLLWTALLMAPHLTAIAQQSFWEETSGAGSGCTFSFSISPDGRLYAAKENGVYRSTDNGRTWVSCNLGSLYSVAVDVDSDGRIFVGVGDGIFRSTDDCTSWRRSLLTQRVNPGGGISLTPIVALEVLDGDEILAGTIGDGVYRSSDHGSTWALANSGLTGGEFYEIEQGAGGIVYAAGYAGVFRSMNKGISWSQRLPYLLHGTVYGLATGDSAEVFAGISYIEGEAGVFRSTDAAATWTKIGLQHVAVTGLAYDFHGLLFAAVPDDWNPANTGVYMTTKPFGQWDQVIDGLPMKESMSVAFTPDGHVVVGTQYCGIYRSREAVGAPILSAHNYFEDRSLTFHLEQNFPNPFNPSTTIEYDIPSRTQVSLKVYNVIGQEVTVLVDEEQPAGHKSVQFDASALPSGVYLYRLAAGEFTETKKLVVLR
jgi:hypothetical protein